MFRKGGNVGEGIMSKVVDRGNYNQGQLVQDVEARQKLLEKFAGPGPQNALSNLLIRGGLNLVSGKGAGKGNLAGIAESFREPTEAFMKEKATEDQFRRQIGLSAATGVIGERQARELALLKAAMKGDRIALQKLVEYAIEMGEFPDTAEGRKQAFEKYSKSASDITRASKEQRLDDLSAAYQKDGYSKSDADSLAFYDYTFKSKIPKYKQGKPFKSNKGMPKDAVVGKFYFDIDSDTLYYYDGKFNTVTPETISNFIKSETPS